MYDSHVLVHIGVFARTCIYECRTRSPPSLLMLHYVVVRLQVDVYQSTQRDDYSQAPALPDLPASPVRADVTSEQQPTPPTRPEADGNALSFVFYFALSNALYE